MKNQIESLYINAVLNNESPSYFADKMLDLIGIDGEKDTRTNRQNKARWRYLNLVASILNNKGYTLDVPGLEVPIKWNKDLLYHMHWQASKNVLYPEKNRQLDTYEFSKLTEHVRDLFAMIFDIYIPFPNIKDKLIDEDYKKMNNG